MSSGADLPESITRVHRIATLIASLNREDAAAAGIVIAAASPTPGPPPPATTAAIEALPRVASEGWSCAICLEDAAAGTDVSEMPCKHRFHPDCLAGWLLIHGSCPVCRHVMGEAEAGEENGSGSPELVTDTNSGSDPADRSRAGRVDFGSDLQRSVTRKGRVRSWIFCVCVMFLALGIWFGEFSGKDVTSSP